jgi:hypothetical protein
MSPVNKTTKLPQYPLYINEKETDSTGIVRYSEIPTPEKLKRKALFGIPLVSRLANPPEQISDETLQDYINESISKIEHVLDIYIKPIAVEEDHDFDKEFWRQSFAYFKLYHPNVIQIDRIRLRFINRIPNTEDGLVSDDPDANVNRDGIWLDIPREYVYFKQEGTIQIIPAYGQSLSGWVVSALSGVQFYALTRTDFTVFPGAVRVKYTCGFEDGKIPAMISALIEYTAAVDILSSLGPLIFPFSSVGVSMDGVSQSTGMPGPMFLKNRIDELRAKRDELMEAAKGYYGRSMLIDFV